MKDLGRVKAEEALRESEEKYRTLIETTDTGYVIVDEEGRVHDANTKYISIIGYETLQEILGKQVTEWTAEHDRARNYEAIKLCLKQGFVRNLEIEYVNKEQHLIPIEINATILQTTYGTRIVALCRDITERKQTHIALKESEARLRQVIDLVPHFIFAKNRRGQFILVNKAVADNYGTTVESLVGKTDADFDPNPEEVAHFLKDDIEVMNSGRPKDIPEEKITDSEGKVRMLHTIKIPYHITSTVEDAILGVSTDITERKRAEEALRQSEERFRSLVQNSMDMITVHDKDLIMRYATPSMEQILGYKPEQLIGKNPLSYVHPDDMALVIQEVEKVYAHRAEGIPTEYRFRHADGSWMWVESVANNQLNNQNIRGIILTSRGITERKQAKTQLEQLNKQLRDLAASIQRTREEESTRIAREIHDELGQQLTAIKIDLSFLEEEFLNIQGQAQPTILNKLRSMMFLIDSSIQTVRKIATELRPAILDSMGLSAAIEWLMEDFQGRTGILCQYNQPKENIELDKMQSIMIFRILQESLTNIMRHARARTVTITLQKTDGELRLDINDDGRGISEGDLKKMKSFGIFGMKERAFVLGGRLSVQGEPGKGTTIHFVLPLKEIVSDR